MYILIANVGSTSFKFQLFDRDSLSVAAVGRLERIGSSGAPVSIEVSGSRPVEQKVDLPDYTAAIRFAMDALLSPADGALRDLSEIVAVGFKPVHGFGLSGCVELTDDVLSVMTRAIPLSPAHNPPYIEAVRQFRALLPGWALYGLFEPTFHETIPAFARAYGVPRSWETTHGIRKYGFHGASHRYVAERTPALMEQNRTDLKIVSCHLGGSSSVCAIVGGESVDTSMGLTPQSGLMQSNRCGDLDPFAVLYIMDKENRTTDEMREVLCRESGLKGLSGIKSGDMRDLLENAKEGHSGAETAAQAFTYDVRKMIGSYAAAMEGLNAVVFTGGIGERSAEIRQRICSGLQFLGIELDPERNEQCNDEGIISRRDAIVTVAVIEANEELIIARAVAEVIDAGTPTTDHLDVSHSKAL